MGCCGGGRRVDLPTAYLQGGAGPQRMVLDATRLGVAIRDAATPIGGNLFLLDTDAGAVIVAMTAAGLRVLDGTVAAPAYGFNGEAGMGMYRGGTDELRLTADGVTYIGISAGTGRAALECGFITSRRTGSNGGIDCRDSGDLTCVQLRAAAPGGGDVAFHDASGNLDARLRRSGAAELTLSDLSTGKSKLLLKRLYREDTALGLGDFALSAGWGATAAVSSISGDINACQFTVTANGAGLAANPTVTITFPGGSVGDAPFAICSVEAFTGSGFSLATRATSTTTGTALVITVNATPVAADTITLRVIQSFRK